MLRFIQIGDTHIGPTRDHVRYGHNTYAYAQRLIEHLNNELGFTPDFVVHTGDMTDFPTPECTQLAAEVFSKLRYPIYYVVGNHDGRGPVRQYLLNQPASDERLFYDFQHDDVHFFVLDTIGDIDPAGLISADQLAWLTQQLAQSKAESVCILMHHLPVKMGVRWYDEQMQITNSQALMDILQPHLDRLRGVLFGHIHRPLTAYKDGIMFSAVGSAFMQFRPIPTDQDPTFDPTSLPSYCIVTLWDGLTTVTHNTCTFEDQ